MAGNSEQNRLLASLARCQRLRWLVLRLWRAQARTLDHGPHGDHNGDHNGDTTARPGKRMRASRRSKGSEKNGKAGWSCMTMSAASNCPATDCDAA